MRPSPRISSKKPKRVLRTHEASDGESTDLRPTTPEASNAQFNFTGSSPTPRRGRAEQILSSDAIEPPSSPPERHEFPELVEISHISTDYSLLQDGWDVPSSPPEIFIEIDDSHIIPSSLPAPGRRSLPAFKLETSNVTGTKQPIIPSTPVLSALHSDGSSKTPAEVFVDALSSPVYTSSSKLAIDIAEPGAESSTEVDAENERRESIQCTDLDEVSMLRLMEGYECGDENSDVRDKSQQVSLPNTSREHEDEKMSFDSSPVNYIKSQVLPNESPLPSQKQTDATDGPATESTNPIATSDIANALDLSKTRQASMAARTAVPQSPNKEPKEMTEQSTVNTPASEDPALRRHTSARVQNKAVSTSQTCAKRKRGDSTSQEVSDSQASTVAVQSVTHDFMVPVVEEVVSTIEGMPMPPPAKRRGRPSKAEKERRESQLARERMEEEMRLQMSVLAQSQEEEEMMNAEEESSFAEGDEMPVDQTRMEELVEPRNILKAEKVPVSNAVLGDKQASQPSERLVLEDKTTTPPTAAGVMAQLASLVSSLKDVALSREEASAVDDMVWDLKGALAEAEKRGRELWSSSVR